RCRRQCRSCPRAAHRRPSRGHRGETVSSRVPFDSKVVLPCGWYNAAASPPPPQHEAETVPAQRSPPDRRLPVRTAFAAEPQLPFVLRDRTPDDFAAVAVFDRLNALYGLMTETRAELAELRVQNARLLELVLPRLEGPPTVAERAVEIEVANPVAPQVRVRLLGAFELSIDGRPVDRWRSRKARQLLAYLALTPGRP